MKRLSAWAAAAACSVLSGMPSAWAAQNVLVVKITEQASGLVIDKVTARAGTLPDSRLGAARQAGAQELEVLDSAGRVIYAQPFAVTRYAEVPLPEPGSVEKRQGVTRVRLAQPQAAAVLPHLPEGKVIRIKGYGRSAPVPSPAPVERVPQAAPSQQGYFHVLLLASGFSDMSGFQAKAQGIKSLLLSKEPFASRSSKIVMTAYENTADLGCFTGCAGIDRLLCCDLEKVADAAVQSERPYDEIIVIHNTSTYSGSGSRDMGGYQSDSSGTFSTVYNGSWTELMALHEFGHSFGNLCDEYTYSSEGYDYYDCVNCRPSCSEWSAVSSACQLSCDARSDYYRPEDSIMLNYSAPQFNAPSIAGSLLPRLSYFLAPPPPPKRGMLLLLPGIIKQ